MLEKNEVVVAEVVTKEEDEGLGFVFTLNRPKEFEGKKYDKITLDFEQLTGVDIEKAEMQFNAENLKNMATPMKELNKAFLAIVASKAAGVHVNLIRSLSVSDYSKITTRTSMFLMGGK